MSQIYGKQLHSPLEITSSWANNAVTASYAMNGGKTTFPYTGSAVITGSLIVNGIAITGVGSAQHTEIVSLDISNFSITLPGTYVLSDTANSHIINFPNSIGLEGYTITIVNPTSNVVPLGPNYRPFGLESEVISELGTFSTNTYTSIYDAGWYLTGHYNY